MKPFLTIIAAIAALGASAQISDGYYRVQNATTTRYCYICDNHASVDNIGTVDVSAVWLYIDQEKQLTDPATVVYFKKITDGYDLQGQGASVYEMTDYAVKIRAYGGGYWLYGTDSGASKFLFDPDTLPYPLSFMMMGGSGGSARIWNLIPMDDADNYLGVAPTVSNGGKYYASWYCSFPVATTGSMEAWAITEVNNAMGVAVYEPIADGKVAGAVPVIFVCSSDKGSDNKLTVGGTGNKPETNLLQGVYFDNTEHGHVNYLANDNTIRVLGITSDGSLGFVKSSEDIIPRNTGYLKVSANAPAEFKLMSRAEYAAGINSAVADSGITVSGNQISNPAGVHIEVVNILGTQVYSGSATTLTLSPGLYILRTPSASAKLLLR